MKQKATNSIVYQLLLYILLLSSFFTVIATIAQIWIEYNKDVQILKNRIIEVERSYKKSLALSIWDLDKNYLTTQMIGILQLPEISYIEIESDQKYSVGQKRETQNSIVFKFPIIYSDPANGHEKENMGTLEIVGDLDFIHSRLKDRIFVILYTQAAKTFSVSIFIVFIIWRFIARPLTIMAEYTRKLNLDNLNTPLKLPIGKKFKNELHLVAESVNHMRENLSKANTELQNHKEHLERLVKERTEKLEKQTKELIVAKNKSEEATKIKSEFLANMSHEIRTPMNAIIGLTNLALQTNLSITQKDYLLKVSESSKHLLDIINEILDFSKIEAGKMELEHSNFMLHHILDKMANMFRTRAAEKSLELFYIIEKGIPLTLKGDQLRIGQILINLISNAIKFTEKGEIVIKVQKHNPICMENLNRVGLKISVADSGIGIKPNEIEKLFQPFTQTDGSVTRKYGGTGLGLSICSKLVELMKGEIWVESEVNKGSAFYFTLCLEQSEIEEPYLLSSPPDIKGLKVLVADDNQVARQIIKQILESFDLDVTIAESSPEALELLLNSNQHFQLLVTDWKMPDIDGIQLAEKLLDSPKLKNTDYMPKIILISMYSKTEFIEIQKRKEIHIDAFLQKPVNSSELFNTIMEVFGKDYAKVPRIDLEEKINVVNIENIAGAKILIVEDNEINQKVASIILEKAGLETEIAVNGQDAVNLIQQRKNDKNQPFFDAVLMDMEMPVLDGYSATAILRKDESLKKLPIIAMTAHALKGDMQKCLDAGTDDYISKPIDERELFIKLVKWITPVYTENPKPRITTLNQESTKIELPHTINGINIAEGLNRVKNNEKLYKDILINFSEKYLFFSSKLKKLINENELDEAAKQIHSIKGVSANISADNLFEASKNLETAIKNKNTHVINQNFSYFQKQLDIILKSIGELQLDQEIEIEPQEDFQTKNMEDIKDLMQEIKDLLETSNSKVRHSIPLLKAALKGFGVTTLLNNLEKAVYNLDMDKALNIVNEISKKLKLDF